MSRLSTAVQRGAARFGVVVPATLFAFLSVGMTGLAVNLALVVLLDRPPVPFYIALAVALIVATAVTWFLNRRVTFAPSGRRAHHEALRYFIVALVAQGVNYAVSLTEATLLPHIPHVLDVIGGAVVATLFSYTGQRLFTFAPVRPDAPGKTDPKA